MRPGRDFGDDSSIGAVRLMLGKDAIGKNALTGRFAPVTKDGGCRFVATCLDSQNNHEKSTIMKKAIYR